MDDASITDICIARYLTKKFFYYLLVSLILTETFRSNKNGWLKPFQSHVVICTYITWAAQAAEKAPVSFLNFAFWLPLWFCGSAWWDRLRKKRKKRKEEKKMDRPYLLLDVGQGPYVVGSQKRRKAARKRPHRCYIHIHQIKSHISTRFFLVQRAPRFVEPTYGIPGYILLSIKPVPSSQHAIVADARFSSPLLPPIKHTCELSSPFTEHSRLSESRSHAIPA